MGSSIEAKEIYQGLLDRIALAYSADDFDAFAMMVRVPHEVSTFGPKMDINTRSDLRVLFDGVRVHFARLGVTDYIRTCLTAEYASLTEIVGMHETRILAGTQVLEEPYPVKSHLHLIEGRWWVCKSDNAIMPDEGMGSVVNRSVTRLQPSPPAKLRRVK